MGDGIAFKSFYVSEIFADALGIILHLCFDRSALMWKRSILLHNRSSSPRSLRSLKASSPFR